MMTHRRIIRRALLCCALLFSGALSGPGAAQAAGEAVLLDIQGPIGPATADYVHSGIETAKKNGAALIILRMDTPGGLDLSMRDIIRDILASPVPVAAHVAPSGARAASAGTYILYASHIAAMAPATTLGAATPIRFGGPPVPANPRKPPTPPKDKAQQEPEQQSDAMKSKMINDAAAYIRGLAQLRGRNADWAELAVRRAASLSASEALKKNVIDLIAADTPALIKKLHGRVVKTASGKHTLHTRDMTILPLAPDWRAQLLSVITDPNVAYVLMLLGIYGLFFELANPGFVLPGVIGAICLILALFAFQTLPVNYAGLGLIALGVAFMVGEVFAPSFGALGIGGIIAFVMGSIILMEAAPPGFELSMTVIAAVTITTALFFLLVAGMAIKARKRPVVSGMEDLIGALGAAHEAFDCKGRVLVHGELWQAKTKAPLKKGDAVRVVALDGLYLDVEPVSSKET